MIKSRKISLRISHLLVSASLFLKPFACLVKDTGNIPKSFRCWQSQENLGKLTSEIRALGQFLANNFEPSCYKDLCLSKKPPNCFSSPEIIPDYFRIDWKRAVMYSLASIPSRPECESCVHVHRLLTSLVQKPGVTVTIWLKIAVNSTCNLPSISWRKFPVERLQEWIVLWRIWCKGQFVFV